MTYVVIVICKYETNTHLTFCVAYIVCFLLYIHYAMIFMIKAFVYFSFLSECQSYGSVWKSASVNGDCENLPKKVSEEAMAPKYKEMGLHNAYVSWEQHCLHTDKRSCGVYYEFLYLSTICETNGTFSSVLRESVMSKCRLRPEIYKANSWRVEVATQILIILGGIPAFTNTTHQMKILMTQIGCLTP